MQMAVRGNRGWECHKKEAVPFFYPFRECCPRLFLSPRQHLFTEQPDAVGYPPVFRPRRQAEAHDDVVHVVIAAVHGQSVDALLR